MVGCGKEKGSFRARRYSGGIDMHWFWAVLTFTGKLEMMMIFTIRRTIKNMLWLNRLKHHQILKFLHLVRNFPQMGLLMGLFNKNLLIAGKLIKEKIIVETDQ